MTDEYQMANGKGWPRCEALNAARIAGKKNGREPEDDVPL